MYNQPLLTVMVSDWMRETLTMYDDYTAFDLAVDCAHDLGLTGCDYEIPQWIIELAELTLEEKV